MAEFQRESKTFSQVLNFTRGSTGTYFDASGVLQTAAVDEPRFTHDPDTLEAQGLLIEEQRTNLFLQSEDFGAAEWSDSLDIVVTSGVGPSVRQGGSSDQVDFSAAPSRLSQNYTGGVVSRSLKFVVKHISGEPTIRVRTRTVETTFDIVSGVITAGTGGFIEALGGGFYEIGHVKTEDDSRAGLFSNGACSIYVDHCQLEEGAFPTSYIKTEGSQVTRSADRCSRTLGSEFNASEGALFLEILNDELLFNGLENATIFSIGELGHDVISPFLSLYASGSTPSTVVLRYLGSVQSAITSPDMSGTYKIAVKYDQSTAEIYINGSLRGSIAKGAGIDSPEELLIGYGRTGGFLDAILSKINYYPRALSETELEALTS